MTRAPRTAAPPPPPQSADYPGYSIGCTADFRHWLRDLSWTTRIPASLITREALREWAKRRGHAAPPPR